MGPNRRPSLLIPSTATGASVVREAQGQISEHGVAVARGRLEGRMRSRSCRSSAAQGLPVPKPSGPKDANSGRGFDTCLASPLIAANHGFFRLSGARHRYEMRTPGRTVVRSAPSYRQLIGQRAALKV